MKRRYHVPTRVIWDTEVSGETGARLQRAILAAIRQTVENAAGHGGEVVVAPPASPELVRELFSSARYRPGHGTYSVPSYDDAGEQVEVNVRPDNQETEEAPARQAWTEETIAAHIRATFGEYGPRGQTSYGVQTPGGLTIVTGVAGGRPQLGRFAVRHYRRDTEGHWLSTGEEYVYPVGRYVFRVVGPAPQEDAPRPYVAVVEDLQGRIHTDKIWTRHAPGYRLVFDVPVAPYTGGSEGGGDGGSGGGSGGGILPGRGINLPFQCYPTWNTGPLTDPAYAGMSDDDLWRLFVNLCNARAIHNLYLSEQYLRKELVPRYTGPGGATNTLSDFSRHSIEHFQERLRLLRALMFAYNRLDREIDALNARLNPLIFQQHRTSGQFITPLGFGARMSANVFWPTLREPAPQHAALVRQLRAQLDEKGTQFRTVLQGILRLLEEDPFLTYFVEGLKTEGGRIDVPDEKGISARLAEVPDLAEVQHEILKQLDVTLASLRRAVSYLCRDPERILDVPLVYEQVLSSLEGINERFDQVAREGIARHRRRESWIDIGLSAAGLVLFVGGLIVSLAGGPAGVVAFLSVSGTVLGGVSALRSLDKAGLATALANASVERGRGLITLEAARDARFWATLDAVLVGADAVLGGVDIVRLARPTLAARQARATARLTAAAEEFEQTVEVGRHLDFETLLARARPRGDLPIDPAELQALGAVPTNTNVAGQIAEELVERAILPTGEYLPLASKLNSNQGIDLVFVRRTAFERIFGPIANPRDARNILAGASQDQLRQLGNALTRGAHPDDLVSVEVKFTRAGEPLEELLNSARGGVQMNRVWFGDPQRGILQAMRTIADPEVRATGRLLEEVIGPGANFVERMARIGISVDAAGRYQLLRLTEGIIDAAAASKALYRSIRYQRGYFHALLRAERLGDQAKVERFRNLLHTMNQQIDALDEAVRRAKQAQEASRRVVRTLEASEPALREVTQLATRPQTPGVTQALHVATATARAHLEAARQRISEAEADYAAVQAILDRVERGRQKIEADFEAGLNELERAAPGTREAIRRDVEALQREHPELFVVE